MATRIPVACRKPTVAEQPARLLLDNRNLLMEWQATYPVGVKLQGTVVIAAGLAALWAWWLSRDLRWLFGAFLILANWPYTLIVLQPVNAELMALNPHQASTRAHALAARWGDLHAVRGGLGILALATFAWALNRKSSRSP
jgi:Anthrone oxygenase